MRCDENRSPGADVTLTRSLLSTKSDLVKLLAGHHSRRLLTTTNAAAGACCSGRYGGYRRASMNVPQRDGPVEDTTPGPGATRTSQEHQQPCHPCSSCASCLTGANSAIFPCRPTRRGRVAPAVFPMLQLVPIGSRRGQGDANKSASSTSSEPPRERGFSTS